MTNATPHEIITEFIESYDEQHRVNVTKMATDKEMIYAASATVMAYIGVSTKSFKAWCRSHKIVCDHHFTTRSIYGTRQRCINILIFDVIIQNYSTNVSVKLSEQVAEQKEKIDNYVADLKADAKDHRLSPHVDALTGILDNLDNEKYDVKGYLTEIIATVLATAETAMHSLEVAMNDVSTAFGAVVELRAVQQSILNKSNDWSVLLDPKLRMTKALWLKDPLLRRRIEDEYDMLHGLVMAAHPAQNQEQLTQHSRMCREALQSVKTIGSPITPDLKERLQITLLYYTQMRMQNMRKYTEHMTTGVMQNDFMKCVQGWIDQQGTLKGNPRAQDVMEEFTEDFQELVAAHRQKLVKMLPTMDADEIEKNARIAANQNIVDLVNARAPVGIIKQAIADMRDTVYRSMNREE